VTAGPPFIGVLKLETRFPRPPGDIGNPVTHAFPVVYRVVPGASAQRVVREKATGLLEPFIEAGRTLVAEGACAITTTCGFLALYPQGLAQALPVPVATSSLLQVAWVAPLVPRGRRVGILTIDADALEPGHLDAAGVPAGTPVEGLARGSELQRVIFEDLATLDAARVARDVVEAGHRLVRAHPDVGAIVLECTNLPPYRTALVEALRLPVYDCNTLLDWLWRGIVAAR